MGRLEGKNKRGKPLTADYVLEYGGIQAGGWPMRVLGSDNGRFPDLRTKSPSADRSGGKRSASIYMSPRLSRKISGLARSISSQGQGSHPPARQSAKVKVVVSEPKTTWQRRNLYVFQTNTGAPPDPKSLFLGSRSWHGTVRWEQFQRIKEQFPLLRPKLHYSYKELQAIAIL